MGVLEDIFDRYPDEEFLKADGFDDCVIGVTDNRILVYSVDKCIDKLMADGMDEEEAWEYFNFNVSGAYVGEYTPIWVETFE